MTTIQMKVPNWLDRIFAWPVMVYRQWKYSYTFRKIYLGEGLFTIVDSRDFHRLNHVHWCPKKKGQNIYAVRLISCSNKSTGIISMHREIMKPPKGLVVDHANCDGLDNRRANLRPATRSQNLINSRRDKSKSSSQFRGVTFMVRVSRWGAQISYQGKRIWLGTFDIENEAAKAYDEAAKKYHGEFARLNFPETWSVK